MLMKLSETQLAMYENCRFLNEAYDKTKKNIVDKINTIDDLYKKGKGATDKEIKDAEKELGIKFPKQYVEFLKAFGYISFDSHEIFGIGDSWTTSTVKNTKREREVNENYPDGYFIIENLGIEGIFTVMNQAGRAFRMFTENNCKLKLYANSFSEFIDKLVDDK